MSLFKKIVLQNIRRCAGLYFWIGPENEFYGIMTVTALKKGNIIVEKTFFERSLEEILQKVPENIPLIISVDGVNIIHRTINQFNPENFLAQVLPGANAMDFIIQKHTNNREGTIISMVRKDEINTLRKQINEKGLLIFEMYLGPFNVDIIRDIAQDKKEIKIPFYTLFFEINRIVDFDRSLYYSVENNYLFDLNSQKLSSEYLVSFSLCYDFYLDRNKSITDLQIMEQQREFAAKRILHVSVMPFILTVFITLLANFSWYMHYEKEARFLDQSVTSGRFYIIQLDSLRKALLIKQKILETKQNEGAGYISFYSDRIASCVPSGILLKEMTIYPQISTSRNRNNFLFRDKAIFISGLTDNSVSLEVLVKNLSGLSWIESVRILSFSETKDGVRSFDIELEIV